MFRKTKTFAQLITTDSSLLIDVSIKRKPPVNGYRVRPCPNFCVNLHKSDIFAGSNGVLLVSVINSLWWDPLKSLTAAKGAKNTAALKLSFANAF